jgi:hypothetical protein
MTSGWLDTAMPTFPRRPLVAAATALVLVVLGGAGIGTALADSSDDPADPADPAVPGPEPVATVHVR